MVLAHAHRPLPTDLPLSSMQPRSRVQAVRRMLLPTAVRKIAEMLNDSDKHVPQLRHRLEALTRLTEWSRESTSILELQQRILDSPQLANLLETERAFRVMVHRIEAGDVDPSPLLFEPLSIAAQVLDWWNRDMRRFEDLA